MEKIYEPVMKDDVCKRCGQKVKLLSNNLCVRCDDVLYGHKTNSRELENKKWYPYQSPILYPKLIPTLPHYKRKEYMC